MVTLRVVFSFSNGRVLSQGVDDDSIAATEPDAPSMPGKHYSSAMSLKGMFHLQSVFFCCYFSCLLVLM